MIRSNPQITEILGENASNETAVRALYRQLMAAWNNGSGADYATTFAEKSVLVGFNGSLEWTEGDCFVPPASVQ